MSDAVVVTSEAAIAQGSQSFAAAARLFDKETRDDAVMLYAWCRHCDDVIDGQTLGHAQEADFRNGQVERLELLRTQTAAALAGERSADPTFEALRRVVERHQIPVRHPQELLDGFGMDVAKCFINDQPATTDGQFVGPLHERLCRDALPCRIIGIDDNHYIASFDRSMQLIEGDIHDLMSCALQVMTVFSVGRLYECDPAWCTQKRQYLNRRLRTGNRQYGLRTIVTASCRH